MKGVLLKKKSKILLQDKSTLPKELGLCKPQRPDSATNDRDVQRHLGNKLPWRARRGAGREMAQGLPCPAWGSLGARYGRSVKRKK